MHVTCPRTYQLIVFASHWVFSAMAAADYGNKGKRAWR